MHNFFLIHVNIGKYYINLMKRWIKFRLINSQIVKKIFLSILIQEVLTRMKQPPKSPDFNLIEQIWNVVYSRISKTARTSKDGRGNILTSKVFRKYIFFNEEEIPSRLRWLMMTVDYTPKFEVHNLQNFMILFTL